MEDCIRFVRALSLGEVFIDQ